MSGHRGAAGASSSGEAAGASESREAVELKGHRILLLETSCPRATVALAIGDAVAEREIATPREQTDRILGLIDELLGAAGLALADLDAIAFGRGPGSFTGLRVAAAVTQGLAMAAGLPIVSVSSLAGLAQRALTDAVETRRIETDAGAMPHAETDPGRFPQVSMTGSAPVRPTPATRGEAPCGGSLERVLCCNDARMGEVYSGVYRLVDGLAAAERDDAVGPPGAVTAPAGPFIAAGDAFAVYKDELAPVLARAGRVESRLMPRARDLLPLAGAEIDRQRFLAVEAALPVYLRQADAWRRS